MNHNHASRSLSILPRLTRAGLVGAIATIAACSTGSTPIDQTAQSPLNANAQIGLMLRALEAKAPSPASAKNALPKGLINARGKNVGGQSTVVVDVLIEGDVAAIPGLKALGIEIRTVTSTGIMTATLPMNKLHAAAALAGVKRIDAARQVKMYNDRSQALDETDPDNTFGMNNPRVTTPQGALDGAGVIVGVIDSGLDWTHEDFIDDNGGGSRILAYWDQSDLADTAPPAGKDYGTVYSKAQIDAGAVADSAKDTDGHGTHVTGSAAGDGSASAGTYKGGAPASDIVFVKFDFDGDRNSTAAIVDGIAFIFQQAEALGRPAVINMSLGSDFGPHDGSTLEERGIDALTGPGKVVVVAAGNPGNNNWSPRLGWGYAMHGSGEVGVDEIKFRMPDGLVTNGEDADYGFLSIWHDEGTCTIDVSLDGKQKCSYSGTTDPGYISSCRIKGPGGHKVWFGQSTDVFGYESDSGSTESYVEFPPISGEWQVDIHSCVDGNANANGIYHSTHGTSDNVVVQYRAEDPRVPTPTYGGRESDNEVTIGNPASADNVIAVAAYQSRNDWSYVYGTTDLTCDGSTVGSQSYGQAPVDYYDPFALGELAYFSGRGPRRDGVMKPEIAAPGVGIISALSSHARDLEVGDKCTSYFDGGFYHYGTNRVLPGEQYTVLQGTSMACPNATGAIALLLQNKPDLTAAQLRDLFSNTARRDTAVTAGVSQALSAHSDTDLAGGYPNSDWGEGKLDVVQSLAGLPSCDNACLYDSDCGPGGTCTVSTTLNGCSECSGACVPDEPGGEISCDGADNDCDGQTDEGLLNACDGCATLPPGTPGVTDCGECGTLACDGVDAFRCDDPGFNDCGGCGPVPTEICDGDDNDCDGQTDEGLGSSTCGVGACETTVDNCSAGTPQICTPLTPPEPNTEISCSDGIDNDCDGDADGDDSDCAPSCEPLGASCTSNAQCCSNKCKGKPGNMSCK